MFTETIKLGDITQNMYKYTFQIINPMLQNISTTPLLGVQFHYHYIKKIAAFTCKIYINTHCGFSAVLIYHFIFPYQ